MNWLTAVRRREASLLLSAGLLLAGHYAFGEWAWHPGVKFWVERAFWADLPWYAALPPLLWTGWWVLSLGRLKIGSLLMKLAAGICVGDVLWCLVAHNLKVLEVKLPVQYWPAWTYWMPAVLLLGNLVVLRRWWVLVLACVNKRYMTAAAVISEQQSTCRPAWLLKTAATFVCSTALLLTAVHLVPPRMLVGGNTLELAGDFLIPARLQDDFAFVTQQAIWRGKRLGALLDHVELADLQRRQFYPNLDSHIFQTYVLSPSIDRLPLSELDWRRSLWESLLPACPGGA